MPYICIYIYKHIYAYTHIHTQVFTYTYFVCSSTSDHQERKPNDKSYLGNACGKDCLQTYGNRLHIN